MSAARDQVLAAVRRSLKRAPDDEAAVRKRLAEHPRGPVPARSHVDPHARVELFVEQATAVQASVARLGDLAEVPAAVADYLRDSNLPPRLRLSPDPALEDLPWAEQAPLLAVQSGRAEPDDQVSLTGSFAGIAETGTLVLCSGPRDPTTLNFLPETHLALLHASDIVGAYEEAWERLRTREGDGGMPRTVNLITGPSRTGDIEQTLQLGAHGPRRLHILLVEDDGAA